MSLSALFTMRARVVRSVVDPSLPLVYGQPRRSDQEVHSALACYAWTERTREAVDENRSASVVDYRLICAHDAGLQDNDRITLTGNRGGGGVPTDAELVVTGQPIKRRDHLDAMLKLVE